MPLSYDRPSIKIFFDFLIATGIAQPLMGCSRDLPASLTAEAKLPSDLFEGAFAVFSDSETKPENLLLSRRKPGQKFANLLDQILLQERIRRREALFIGDEVFECAVFFTDGHIKRDGLLDEIEDLLHIIQWNATDY